MPAAIEMGEEDLPLSSLHFPLASAGGPGSDLSTPLSSVGHQGLSDCLGLFQDPAVMHIDPVPGCLI